MTGLNTIGGEPPPNICIVGSPNQCHRYSSLRVLPSPPAMPGPDGGASPASRSLPCVSASPTRCLEDGPSPESTLGSIASMKPSAICELCHDGELRVSPNTPTAPPVGLTSAFWTNDVSSVSYWALAQLMLSTTGRLSLLFVSASTSVVVKNGSPHPSDQPWSRCTTMKRPWFHAALTSAPSPSQGNAGFFSAAGSDVPSLNFAGFVVGLSS